jgi:hypothetical protein
MDKWSESLQSQILSMMETVKMSMENQMSRQIDLHNSFKNSALAEV